MKRSRLPLVLVGAAVLLAGVFAFAMGGDGNAVDGELATIELFRDKGQIDRARSLIARCRIDWQGASDDRLARLEAEAAKVDAVADFAAELEREVLDPTSGNRGAWIRRLQELEQGGAEHQRIAARLTRASLTETLLRRPPAPVAGEAGETGDPAVGGPNDEVAANQVDAPAMTAETSADVIADADRLAEQGLFAPAIALLQAQQGEMADPTAVAELQTARERVQKGALAAMRELLASAEAKVEAGRHGEAITEIALVQHRFPSDGEFAALAARRHEIEAASEALAAAAVRPEGSAGMADVAPRVAPAPIAPAAGAGVEPANGGAATPVGGGAAAGSPIAALRDQLDRVRAAEGRGEFALAAEELRKAADLARARDPAYAARLEQRADDAAMRAEFQALLTAAGRPTELSGLGTDALLTLAREVDARGRAAVGAASLVYETGDRAAAERLLAAVLRADDGMKPIVDRALAAGRGDSYDPRGYELQKDGFVAIAELEAHKAAKKITPRIQAALRKKDPAERERLVAALLAEGPETLPAIGIAFRQDLREAVQELGESPLESQIRGLEDQRVVLDKAREFAKDLIYDEVRYFYPYKPPAVASDRYAEYIRVQAEVNRRVAALRGLWSDRRTTVRVPKSLQTALERIEWDRSVLRQIGAFDESELAPIAWARAIPPFKSITIAEYCRTESECRDLVEWRRIEEYNEVVGRELPASVRELLRITNDYRAMYRHRPLAVVPAICDAAQAHAAEMSRLGYFAHMSPTPGHRTPFDRMKLAGYDYGVSENIAINGSAPGAHDSWLNSSGHHRNLLNPGHREMGIGVDGRYWVENFGRGDVFARHTAFVQATGR
ncbi:MAG: hypothetical protein KDE27_02495 [Planctomycetes bacterium]|nr:hypothetical protein [Planctomycetota bacterium]